MIFETLTNRSPIEKGWSGDQKYRAEDAEGGVYLLRVSPPERLERRREAFGRMEQAFALGVAMPRPVEWGASPEGVYTLEEWIDGDDAEELIPTLAPERQYAYGLDAGRILRKLHTLPAPAGAEDWETRFNRKLDRNLARYAACPLKYEVDAPILDFIAAHRHLLHGRPQTWQHGDYHIGNMMLTRDDRLIVIDFDRDDFGDPWEEFNRIVWCAQAAPAFASGMVDGYFGGEVPPEFWPLLALYISSNTLSSLPWAIPFGEGQIRVMREQQRQVLAWYDGMRQVVPTWYQQINEV